MTKLFTKAFLALALLTSTAFAGQHGYFLSPSFAYYEGDQLDVSDTAVPQRPGAAYVWQNGTWTYPLSTAQAAQIATLDAAYAVAIQAPVTFMTAAGVTKTFNADPGSVDNLSRMLLAFQKAQAVPSGFYWLASDNSPVPFTYADMQGLAQAIGVSALTQFQHLQTLKAAVNTATTVADVQKAVW